MCPNIPDTVLAARAPPTGRIAQTAAATITIAHCNHISMPPKQRQELFDACWQTSTEHYPVVNGRLTEVCIYYQLAEQRSSCHHRPHALP